MTGTIADPASVFTTRFLAAKAIVDEQAADERFWFLAERITEAVLQAELRRLHAAIEGDKTFIVSAPDRGNVT